MPTHAPFPWRRPAALVSVMAITAAPTGPHIDRGRIFTYLRQADTFGKFKVDEFDLSIGWINGEKDEIDFGADNLRKKAVNQATPHTLFAALHCCETCVSTYPTT